MSLSITEAVSILTRRLGRMLPVTGLTNDQAYTLFQSSPGG